MDKECENGLDKWENHQSINRFDTSVNPQSIRSSAAHLGQRVGLTMIFKAKPTAIFLQGFRVILIYMNGPFYLPWNKVDSCNVAVLLDEVLPQCGPDKSCVKSIKKPPRSSEIRDLGTNKLGYTILQEPVKLGESATTCSTRQQRTRSLVLGVSEGQSLKYTMTWTATTPDSLVKSLMKL